MEGTRRGRSWAKLLEGASLGKQLSTPYERFGPYELIELLGRGGMGEVFRARVSGPEAAGLPPEVALKRLVDVRPDREADADAWDDFLTEADVAPMLRHPNLVRVYRSGVLDNTGYVVMEVVEGGDLFDLMDRRPGTPLPLPVACYLAAEMLRGLRYLHSAVGASGRPLGLVHRDLSPANVFFSASGEVKLADLGIAQVRRFENSADERVVKGTLRYLSPEQVTGRPCSSASDVFSVAAVIYELLAGRPAFGQEGEVKVMVAIRDGKAQDLRAVAPWVPRPLAKVVMGALRQRLWVRPRSATRLLDLIEEVRLRFGWMRGPEQILEEVERWAAR